MIHWGSKVRAIKGNLCSQWTVKIVQPTKRWWWRGWYSGSTGNLTRVAIWWGFWFLELRLWSSDHRMIILRILISKWGSIYIYFMWFANKDLSNPIKPLCLWFCCWLWLRQRKLFDCFRLLWKFENQKLKLSLSVATTLVLNWFFQHYSQSTHSNETQNRARIFLE